MEDLQQMEARAIAASGISRRSLDVKSRFLQYVSPEPNSGCWLWTGPNGPVGYGSFHFKGKSERAHRTAYRLWNGEPSGLVCHKCDVRCCVNPNHLYLGSHKENMRDMKLRDRTAKGCRNGVYTHPHTRSYGEDHGNSKLTWELVKLIRADNRTCTDIAKELGVARSTIGRIKRGVMWPLEYTR